MLQSCFPACLVMEIYDASLHACMREPASLFAGIEGESEKRKRMQFGGLILQLVAVRIFVKLKLSALVNSQIQFGRIFILPW